MTASDPRVGEIQAIPTEAVEAAAEWLPHSDDCEVRPERDCTCWQPRVNLMRAALEAAAPYMHAYLLAQLVDRDEKLARVEALAEEWRYKGEFGWGAWQEGQGPDQEGYILDQASAALRAAVAAATGGGE